MNRKEKLLIFAVALVFLILPFISASPISDLWNQITGKATSGSTSLNISIGNSAPTIPIVSPISAQNPTEDTTTSINVNFTVNDLDGYQNINTSTAQAYFQKSGETTRSNTSCVSYQTGGDQVNFTCNIDLQYYDGSGSWTINVSAKDINDAYGENSSTTFTYNLLTALKMSPTALTWPQISLSNTNIGSDNDPILVNNTGNHNALSLNVTAYDLQGETTGTEFIYANNFSIENISQGCSGTTMLNATSLNITSAILPKGNHSINDGSTGQEQLYFCLKGVPPTISSQSYSSAAYGSWAVQAI